MSAGYNGYAPIAAFSTTQGPPTAGVNSHTNSVNVNRVWGEYMTPFGQLRFGRMPTSGASAWSTTPATASTRTTSRRSTASCSSAATSRGPLLRRRLGLRLQRPDERDPLRRLRRPADQHLQPLQRAQWGLFAVHKTAPEVQRYRLAHHQFVLNGGIYATYREQYLDVANGTTPLTGNYAPTGVQAQA